MRKKILPPAPEAIRARTRKSRTRQPRQTAWQGRILLLLQGRDPRLLDKETYKVYCRIRETGVRLQGPMPLQVEREAPGTGAEATAGIHRRLFMVFIPTEEFILLLEKLPLSQSVSASFRVEEGEG